MIECKPEQAEPLTALVTKIAAELAAGPITADEFERAKKPILTQIEQMRRDNRYWAQNVVRNCQEHPERIQWSKDLVSDFAGVTLEEAQALAKEFLTKDRAVAVKVLPISKK
ncbi:MAG: hypothetical protein NTV80_08995 [Verrucomicrobia bacterium]|nr:hypothetical protein [Verrucomicrobiota bacterium]